MPERHQQLGCHRSTPTSTITSFTASVSREANGGLRFRYVLHGDIARLVLPAPATPRHTDELWRHSCFETFITTEDDPAYVECNFAPSGAWATYGFDRYRKGMAAIAPDATPRITLQTAPDGLVLEARLKLSQFVGQPLRIGLTAVIEDKAGLSYWALRHPKSRPDFHHRGGFILRLAATQVLA